MDVTPVSAEGIENEGSGISLLNLGWNGPFCEVGSTCIKPWLMF